MSLGSRRPRARRLTLLWLFGVGFALAGLAAGWTRWQALRAEARALADAHTHYRVAHPGWSFPATVWSAPTPLDLPKERVVLEAKARGYSEACPPKAPGEVCPRSGALIPRGGRFPEGVQPPGTVAVIPHEPAKGDKADPPITEPGWTRPAALEPIEIGRLVGPDAEFREHLPLAEAPPRLIAAIIAAEDQDFYGHHGVNLIAAIRAAFADLTGGGYRQGASTLTMQVVRNLSRRTQKTLRRKLWEAATAMALDDYLGKEGVLQIYLDAPYLGQAGNLSICGFQAAARYYWGKDASQLTLAQAATLAAILPAPGRFAPDRHPERAKERRDRVLHAMAEAGWDPAEVAQALAEPVDASPHPLWKSRYPAYLQAVRSWLEDHVPAQTLYGAGLQVFTGLDPVAQGATDALLPRRVGDLQKQLGPGDGDPLQAAAVLIDLRTGLLAAVYGGTVDQATDFSRATQAFRQAGSSIKPLIYALAFSRTDAQGHHLYTAASTVPNERHVFPGTHGWMPRNVGGEYTPTSTLAYGLAWSQNVATASLLAELGGPDALIPFAQKFGFDTRSWPHEMGLALGQGPVTVLEEARFAATIADQGRLVPARAVDLAVDAAGQVRVPPPEPGPQVVTPETAALTRDLMRLVIEYGTGGASRGAGGWAGYPGPAIGKTGTTDSERDLWFQGATAWHAGAVWLGYDRPKRIGASASDLAAPLWGWWMRAVTEGLPRSRDFDGLKLEHRLICTVSGKLGNGTCKLIPAPFLPGTRPHGVCPIEHPPPPEHHYESLWKRKAREAAEARAAAIGDEVDTTHASEPSGVPGGATATGEATGAATAGTDGALPRSAKGDPPHAGGPAARPAERAGIAPQ